MKILSLDTSTEACSAALLVDGEISTRSAIAPREHGALILPMIDALLSAAALPLAELDAIAFGRGPGAFTGVRIAAGVTQGLAWGANLPVIPVSSLAALARQAVGKAATILAAIDARMDEVYYGQFKAQRKDNNNVVVPLYAERVDKPQHITAHTDNSIYGIGSGWHRYAAILTERCQGKLQGYEAEAYPLAEHIIPLAINELMQHKMQAAKHAVPVYLRNNIIA